MNMNLAKEMIFERNGTHKGTIFGEPRLVLRAPNICFLVFGEGYGMILEAGSNSSAQYSMSSCSILHVCSSTSVLQAVQTFLGFVSTMLVVPEFEATFCSVGEFSGVGSKPILCT